MLKNIIVFLIIVILVVFGWYLWQDYQNPEANPAQVVELANLPELALGNGRYINIFYGFAFDYPEGWYIGYEGESAEAATNFWLVSQMSEEDSEEAVGARVDFEVYDIAQVASQEEYFPPMASAADWVVWERSGEQMDSGTPMYTEEEFTLSGSKAVQTVYTEEPPKEVITVLGPYGNYIYRLTYTAATSTAYGPHLEEFGSLLVSFRWFK